MFAVAMRATLGLGQEKIDRRRQCLSSLGFSEIQISDLWRKKPFTISLREEKIKCNVHFLVKIAGLSLTDLVKYPALFSYSMKTIMFPRYRVMEALKSMQVQVPTKKRNKEGLSFLSIVS